MTELSDLPIFTVFDLTFKSDKCTQQLDSPMRKIDFVKLNNFLSNIDWSPITQHSDINSDYEFLLNSIRSSIEHFTFTIKRNHKCPNKRNVWITNELAISCKHKQQLYRDY